MKRGGRIGDRPSKSFRITRCFFYYDPRYARFRYSNFSPSRKKSEELLTSLLSHRPFFQHLPTSKMKFLSFLLACLAAVALAADDTKECEGETTFFYQDNDNCFSIPEKVIGVFRPCLVLTLCCFSNDFFL